MTSPAFSQGVQNFTNLGLYGGQLYDIAIVPSQPDRMFVGSYLGDGLFMSSNGGMNWQPVETNGSALNEDDFKNQANWAVKIAPGNPDVIWAAHNYWVEWSSDGGSTWTHILNGTMQRGMNNPNMPGGCTNCGSCLDYGGTWDDCEYFRFCKTIAVDPSDPTGRTVYVGTSGRFSNWQIEGAIFRTSDGGATWTKMNGGNNFDFNVYEIQIDPQNSNIMWAVTTPWDSLGNGGTLYRSDDAGLTWTAVYTLTDYNGPGDGEAFSAVAVKPDNSNVVLTGTGIGVIRHTYDGNQWNAELDVVPGSAEVEDIVFDPQSPQTVYATWGGGGTGYVARSTDGGSQWEIYQHGYDFWTLEVHPQDSEVLFASDYNQGLFRSIDHGQSWAPVNEGISAVVVNDVAVDPNDSTHILVGAITGVFEKKGAGSWRQLLKNNIRSLEFHPTNSSVFYAGTQGVLSRTFDGGQTWSFGTSQAGGNITDIAIDPTNTSVIYLSSSGTGKIYKSFDEGDSFSEVLSGENLAGQTHSFNTVVIDPSDSQHVFAGGGNFNAPKVLGDLWETRDGGDNWQRTSLQDVIVNALLINPDDAQVIYAGTGYSGGTATSLYKSIDGGATWFPSMQGLDDTYWNAVTDLEFHNENRDILYASTMRRGIYVSNQADTWINLDITNQQAEYDYAVYAIAVSSLYAASEKGLLQLTGTGVVAGSVSDAIGLFGLNNAEVSTNIGAVSYSTNGSYLMVSPTGIATVTAKAQGYYDKSRSNVAIIGGDVTMVDFAMETGTGTTISAANTPTTEHISRSGSGSKVCFIATAAFGSPMADQVELLRTFRDRYLLTNAPGKAFVRFYYENGKVPADYIESHPWLKSPVRLLLYPLIGYAWLMLSTSATTKLFVLFSGIVGLAVIARKFKTPVHARDKS